MQRRYEARDRIDARGCRGRDRKDIVDEERGGRDEAGHRAQVVAGDDVAAAAVRICLDHLGLREDHDCEDADDRDRGTGGQ